MPTTMYNATVELDIPASQAGADYGDRLLDRFADHHAVLARSLLGRLDLILSLPALGLWQATATVRALIADLPVARLTVETSADFDRRSEAEVPTRLLSVTEAAEKLGLTRAGVQRRIDTGTLPALKVGSIWAIPAGAIRG
jgi:excisionase family DNA binding protein